MQQLFRMRDADGNDYDVPNSDMAEFSGAVPNAANVTRYRDANGNDYDVPDADKAEFSAAVPNAQPLRRVSFANGTTRDFTMPEMAKFLRSKEWRESDDYKADREERDREVNAKLGEDGEMHSPAWAGVKGALKGAVQGAWEGGNAAANKIAKAIPEIGNSLESALGNVLNLGGNAPNALGNWFLADSASGKAWLDANLPSETKEWTGYEDWSTKTADKFADVSAMAYKFAPAMATGGSTALVNTMFAADGINAASQTFDNAIENGFTMGEANAAAAASFLVNFYGAKLMTKAGGVAGDVSNPLLRFFGEAGAVGAAMGAQGVGNKGIENVVNGRPITEGMGDAFAEGEVEGFMFHGINAIPGAVMTGWSAAERRIRETRELKEYRRDSLLEVARGEGGGELLNTLLPGEGLDAAIRARKSGEDVSRKIGERAGLPDNMSVAERNEIIDAIARARGERAAQNAVKIDGFRADALNEAIKGVVGGEEYADAIRAEVLSNIKSARELDNPVRRMELVEEAAQKVSAPDEHRAKSMAGMEERARRKADMAEYEKQEAERKAREEAEQNAPRITVSDLSAETPAAPAETGRGQFPEYYEWLDKTGKKDSDKNWRKFVAENDLDPALAGKRPEPPAEKPAVKPDGKGKMVPVEPKTAVEEAKKPEVAAEPPQKPVETSAVAETGKETPEPAKPVETPSRASDAKENVADRIRRLNKDVETAQFWHPDSVEEQIAFIKRNVPEALEATSYEELLRIRDNYARKNYNPDKAARMERKAGVVSKEQHVMTALNTILEYGFPKESAAFNSKPFVEQLKARGFTVTERDGRIVVEGNTYQVRDKLKGNGFKWDSDRKEWYTETSNKPKPDGKGKMVKPKAAESDYGITMSEKPSVDGDGVRYVVKDGPGDAHRMMFNSKAEAEARLGELRAERKAIQESPSATLADGKKVRLLKTDEGWVPYDENFNDLRHGMFKAAKTKAEAVEVAEKGVKWARDVAEENARLKAEAAKPKPDGKGKMVKPAAQKKPVKANPKKAAKVVEEFVSKDKTRASLQSVFHDHENGVAVASDGRVLIATKHGYDPNAKRDPENPFPNWKQIVPDYSKGAYEHIERVVENGKSSLQQKWLDVQEAEVDPAAISSACKKAAALANKIRHIDPVYVRFELPDGKSMIFDGANLRKVADAMAANGITKIKAVGPKAPLLAENADTTILAMPVKFGDADFKPGRGGEHFVIDARTGRVLSAPERSDSVAMFSREWADDLRRQIAKGKAETVDFVRKSSLFKGVLDAVKRGETDAKTAYEGIPSGDNWEKLSQSNKDAFAEWLKLKDENAIAEKMAEHLADSNIDMPKYSWRKKLPSELEKIEKRLAAEDEIDSLMSGSPVASKPAEAPAKRVPDGKGKMVKPEVAKPSEPTPLQKFLSDRPKGLAKKAEQNLNRQINRGNGKYSSDLEEVERAVGTKAYIDTFGDGKGKTYYQINHADGTSETISKTAADYAISRGIESRIEKPTETRELTDREKYDAAKEKYRKAQEDAKKSDGKTPIDKELGSILDSNSPMGVNVRDAATEIIERLTEKYGEGVADELDAHFGKFFKDIEKDNMRRSRAESLIRAFVNSLPRKYELDGWREEIAPRKFEKMGLPDADSIQERLLDLTDEFYGTDFEEAFAPLKFRKIDEAKLSAKDKAAFGKLRNEFEDAIDDLEKSLDLVSTETRTGERRIRGEVQQDVIDTFTSARENVERFLEQAEKYQALKRDKKGRPLFSLAPDGELDFFTESKNEKAKLQRIEPIESEPPKTPEAEINERLDLKRLDPKRRSDPKVLAWAKKNGRNVTNGMATPDAVRAYDEAMTEATAKRARRWFPDMKIVAHKFGETIKRGMHVIEQRIDDPATIAELEKDTVSRLRSMQLRDGKLYPPMAGKVKSGETGKAEWQEPSEPGIWYRADEHPELLDKNGKFTLVKGNGEQIKAAYNPYWHMSKTALNDQFSSAYKRPELVTVEVSAPRSEAEAKRGEGYWATGAKDPVGETKWPKGPVSGQLAKAGAPERKVTLTRHNKIVRVLPTEEVADRIKAEIDACPRKDVQVEVPFNCVTPQLRDALVERGVKIGKPARLSGPALKEATAAYENWKVEADAINNLEKNWSKSRTASSAEEAASIVKSAGIVNKPLSNKALGIKDAIVTGNNLSEMKNEKAVKKSLSPRLHAIAVANVDKLFETAFTKLTHPDTHGRKEVTQTHRLGSLMKDPATGNYEPVMITVLEYEKYGHRIYTVEAVDVLKYKTPAGQLVDSALPAITPRLQEFVKSLANKAAKVNGGGEKKYLRDTSGGVLGWFDPKSKEVHLLPGADPKTVAHEIMWHGTRQYMTDLAAKGDARAQKFLDMMHDVEQNAPQAIKDLVNRIYARGGKAISRDTLLNEYGAWFTMGKGGEALEKALQTDAGRNWFARGLHTVKEMVKDFLTAHGRNRVDLSAIDSMTRDEFVDFLAKEFSGGKTLGNIKGKQPPTLSTKETALQRYKRRFYDQNAAVRDLERDIEKKTGKKISADDSVEAANALKNGLKEAANRATQGKMREFRKVLFETGISPADLEYYAALKAAAGRDAKIDARNIAKLTAKLRSEGASAQDIADAVANYKSSNGSHIDPREAKMMLNEIENGPDAANFKKAYDALRPIIDETLDTQVNAGLVGATEAAQWRTEEPYYIPFKNEYDAETGEWAGRGMSRNYAKPEHYTAKGRQSAAGDILAHIFMDHQAAKLRAIENGVRQKLAKLVRANPELGKVEVLGDNEAGIEANNPNVVVFKDGGRAYKITLEGTRGEAIANAFTQRNQLKMGWADRKFMGIVSMRGFARATAGMATRYSPTFAIRNTTKDNIELANIVYSERGPIEGSKFMGRYIASRAQMAGTLAKYITTGKIDTTTAHGKILDRYIKAGGLIAGGTRAEAFDSIKKSLTPEAIAKEMRRGNSKTRAVAKHVLNSIGYLNEYAEMATRVGIFDAEIKAGKSDAEAALFARRATVDFNRHGDWTPAFNMFRLFSNSTLGASARAAAALTKSKYGAAAMSALFVNGLARAFIDHFVNADEDERRRKTGEATGKDISEYERRTSLFYFRNGDKLYKVAEHESPFSLVSYAGDCVGRWICGDLDGKQVAKNLGVTTAEVAYNFLPMGSINLTAQNGGFAEDAKSALISGVVPTAAQPIAELWANIDYAGRTIYNDPGHDNKTPRAEQGRDSTPDWAKEAAVKLNESTRSEGRRKGYVDIPPEAIQKLVEGYGKNALRDVSMAVSIGEAIIKGDFSKLDPRNEPVKRDFVRPLDGNDKRFIAATKEFEANLDYFKKTEMTDDERVDYLAKFPHIRGKRGSDLLAAIKKFRKMERGFAYKNGKAIPHEWPQEKLDEFKEKRRALQAQFLELMGDK